MKRELIHERSELLKLIKRFQATEGLTPDFVMNDICKYIKDRMNKYIKECK